MKLIVQVIGTRQYPFLHPEIRKEWSRSIVKPQNASFSIDDSRGGGGRAGGGGGFVVFPFTLSKPSKHR